MIVAVIAAIVGLASALAYLWRRRWMEAALVLAAAAALAAIAADFSLPAAGRGSVTIEPGVSTADVAAAATVTVDGDGLRAAQWRDLPARPLRWTAPASDVLRLDFPRQLALGRIFTLTVRRAHPAAARLQLLAENGQVIAEASGSGADLSVQWLPPVAETLVLKARVLDAAGKLVAEGPLPFSVQAAPPLQVQGRFGAPSFDVRALNDLLANSNALLDWQVTLGKTVTRNETARAAVSAPDLVVADAAYVEHLNESARAALLAQVAQGTPLVILASNAADAGFWSRALQLPLKPQAEGKLAGAPLAMALAPLNPAAKSAGAWSASDDRSWTRPWQKGRIVWLGVGDWHRYAISEPRALALWWQDVLDQAGVRRPEQVLWQAPEEMPLPGQRLELCAQGVQGDVDFPELGQHAAWQRRPDRADAACVAVWPKQPGWLHMHTQTQDKRAVDGAVYVFAAGDWPMWQRGQRRDATAHYAARTPVPQARTVSALPGWPFAILFMLAMLGLWWRERR